MEFAMNKILLSATVVGVLALPALAQQTSTCAEYTANDDTGRLRIATELESAASQMSTQTFTAGEIRAQVDTRCEADPAKILITALLEVVE
jgi:hypothetical protein